MRRIRLFVRLLVVLGVLWGIQIFLALAEVPVIGSITPDSGWNALTTDVTITGSNFEQGAKLSLFGGGPYIKGSIDSLMSLPMLSMFQAPMLML